MQLSRYNIISEIPGSEDYVIANLLTGHADIVKPEELQQLKDGNQPASADFTRKGYLTDPEAEKQRFRLAHIDFLEQRDQEEVQVFFAPTYLCNFQCSYCYQAPYLNKPDKLSPEVTDAFFHYINTYLGDRRKYVTLFGGEPLLADKAYKDSIAGFVNTCQTNGLDLAVVTNGYLLDQYIDIFKDVSIREIQVTLDGPEEVHNRRRPHKGGRDSFARIAGSIDDCLDAGLPVNLRMVVDRENLHTLPDLARYAINRGWTDSPLFKTQLGRNYELHHCHSDGGELFSRLSLYKELYQMLQEHPEILDFHRPAFSIARFLSDNGRLPPPLFDACPACKGEWAMDYTGKIYGCTATVGKPGEELGSFYPVVSHHENKIEEWQRRDITTIEACRQCNIQLACGGGCGSLAKNNHGSIHQADCRPVDALLGMGVATYF